MSTKSDFLVPLICPWCLDISACTYSTVPGNYVFIIKDWIGFKKRNPLRFMYTSLLTMLLIW